MNVYVDPFECPTEHKCQSCSTYVEESDVTKVLAPFPFTIREWECCPTCADHINRTGKRPPNVRRRP